MKKLVAENPLRTVSLVQGLYYLGSGLWSLLDISSFQAVTGPKQDLWLVKTVGLLLIVCAGTLLSAAFRRAFRLEVAIIGIGTASALAVIDFVYVYQGIISAIYILDAGVEIVFVAIWIGGAYLKMRKSGA